MQSRKLNEKLSPTHQLRRSAKENLFLPTNGLHSTRGMNPHRRLARFVVMAATADAHEPVPEDCVSPTPRSKRQSFYISLIFADDQFNVHPIFERMMATDFGCLGLPTRMNSFTKTT